MIHKAKIYRPERTWLDEEGSICQRLRVIAEVRGRKIFLADAAGQLVPVTRRQIERSGQLRDPEIRRLLAATEWTPQRAEREDDEATFTLAVPLPPLSEFQSIGSFMRWVDSRAGERTHPSDVLLHRLDLAELLGAHREWLRTRHGLRGDKLTRTVNAHDIGGAPCEAWRGSSIAPGWCFIRSTSKRARGRA